MERYCLDAQYAFGVLPREAIYYLNYGREMRSFSFGIDYEDPVV